MRDAAARLDMRRLDDHEASAGHRELAKVHQVPVGRAAVDRAVLAHRRHDDAVRQSQTAQRDRRKQHTRHRLTSASATRRIADYRTALTQPLPS